MAVAGLAMNLGGDVTCRRFTVTAADLVASGAALTAAGGTITTVVAHTLMTLKAESVLLGGRLRGRTVFAGTGITDADVTVGWGAFTTGTVVPATGDDIFSTQDVDTALISIPNGAAASAATGGPMWITFDADTVIKLFITTAGANVSLLTSGELTVDLFFYNQTTPVTAGV